MGMFPVQNYGADFVNSMAATAGMFNDRKRLDMEERRQARADETADLQREGLRLENQKKALDNSIAAGLQDYLGYSQRLNSGNLEAKDWGRATKSTVDIMQAAPFLPNDPAEIPKYKQSISAVLNGVEQLRGLPASNYTYSRADNIPEVNAALDGFQTLLSKDRLGREFTDADGSVTGKPGSVYKTAGVGGFAMVSGEGNEAAFVPMFSVTDAQGQPLMRQDGRPVLVPSTEGQTNGAGDRVRKITPEEMMTKAGFAYRVLNDAEKLGLHDPEKRQQYITANLPLYMGEEGAKEMLRQGQKETGLVTVDPTHDVYDKKGNLLAKGTPKAEKPEAPHNLFGGEVSGRDLAALYPSEAKQQKVNPNKFYRVTKDGARVLIAEARPPKETGGGSGGGSGGNGGDGIDLRTVKGLAKRFQELDKQRNSQLAKDEAELRDVNAKRVAMSDPPLTREQYFGGKNSSVHEAITSEMYQLRDIAAKEHGYDLIKMKPMGTAQPSQAAPQQTAKGMNQSPQKAAPAKPITATNPATGERIISNDGGASWQPMGQPVAKPKQAAPQPQPKQQPKPQPKPQPRKGGFFDEVAEKHKGMQRDNDTRKRAAAANASPNDYVTAYDSKGNSYRTLARNARFNTSTLRWEMKG